MHAKVFLFDLFYFSHMQKFEIDHVDRKILKALHSNANASLSDLRRKTGVLSESALSRRIKKMKDAGVIKGQQIILDYDRLGYEFQIIVFVKARYGPGYIDIVAEKIRKIKGVVSLTFLLGDIDFVVSIICRSKDEYALILEQLTNIDEIERSDSRTVLKNYDDNFAGFLDM